MRLHEDRLGTSNSLEYLHVVVSSAPELFSRTAFAGVLRFANLGTEAKTVILETRIKYMNALVQASVRFSVDELFISALYVILSKWSSLSEVSSKQQDLSLTLASVR